MSQITTFSAVQAETNGKYWDDFIPIDKTMIEANWCPHCHRSLTYSGKSKADEYRAYGVCEPCDFAKLFWTEKVEISGFKKQVCQTVAVDEFV